MDNTKLYKLLAYLGTLPFILCSSLSLLSINQVFQIASTEVIIRSYSIVIISFMAGIHWATQLLPSKPYRFNLFILSNLLTLASWIAYLLASQVLSIIVFIIAFSFLLLIDFYLKKDNIIPSDYFKTRFIVTIIVVTSLATYLTQSL